MIGAVINGPFFVPDRVSSWFDLVSLLFHAPPLTLSLSKGAHPEPVEGRSP